MDDSVNPYSMFIEVLAHRHAGTHVKALTGEMIATYAELSHLLGRTKGKVDVTVWGDCAEELHRCHTLYGSAWTSLKGRIDEFFKNPDAPLKPDPGITPLFQAAVDGARAALETMRHEFHLMGGTSWVV